jgi:glycosyltransferase involved in cell wall biosynthesis
MISHAQKPRVSVILPTYNRAWSLHAAIKSVLTQTYSDYELIIVDDGSTDETATLLRTYDGVTVFHQSRQGVSAARNRGVQAARGELIAFLDSDDYWLPDKLSGQVRYFDENPDALICQTEEIWIRRGVRVNPGRRHRKRAGMIFEPSLALCLVSPSAVMLRRSLFVAMGGFDERLPACEDYDLWLRIGCRYPIGLIETPLIVKQGGHDDQLSAEPGLDRYRIQSLTKIIASGNLTEDQRRAAIKTLQTKCMIYAIGCRKRGRPGEAARYEKIARDTPPHNLSADSNGVSRM